MAARDPESLDFCDTFMFIDLPNTAATRKPGQVRAARSHAIRTALARQRHKAQQHGENFRSHQYRSDHTDGPSLPPGSLPRSIGAMSIDPFDSLVVDSRRLTGLLHARTSLQAGEPIFSVNDAVRYQSLHTVFGSGLSDGALTAAVSLTLCYAANGWKMDQESMHYGTVALRQIRHNLANPTTAASAMTIGAILLLLGNEYRLGECDRAQAHLNGIDTLLRLCSKLDVELSPALRRAIYWQDLFSSIYVQTRRIVQFPDFYPSCGSTLHITDRILSPPTGFVAKARELGPEFMDIAAEIAFLYRNRTEWMQSDNISRALDNIDAVQARIEGRLHDLRQSAQQGIVAACHIALYLCIYSFWDGIWNAVLIPRGLSTQLLYQLRRCAADTSQVDTEILFWLLHIGEAFAVDSHVRDGIDQIREERFGTSSKQKSSEFVPNSPGAINILKTFIWSDVFCDNDGHWFWERITI